ncbi:hypothetical protein KEM55_008916, partial [Ascosphaera atra]
QRANGGPQAQYRDAPRPPPLTGSWRGVVAGQNNSPAGMNRGRGDRVLPIRTRPHTHPFATNAANGSPRGGRGGHPGNPQFANTLPAGQSLADNTPTGPSRGRGGFVPRGRGILRGRGGPAQAPARGGGYVVVDRVDPDAGIVDNNPNFHPRPYNTMPPPPMLNNRGRGRGRGRGGFSRGRGTPGRGM